MKFRKTRLVRTLCRLFGEEKGQAMMEYVVLAVLIVAAAVFAVVKFGGAIVRQFGVAEKGAVGNEAGAVELQQQSQDTANTDVTQGQNANAAYSTLSEGGGEGGEGEGSSD
ncbi:MAG: hypothetical protein IJV65_02520 [Kiritimatiellae bacterium]|nr:hypothetical protein [Kiritimatiellia bacterium]